MIRVSFLLSVTAVLVAVGAVAGWRLAGLPTDIALWLIYGTVIIVVIGFVFLAIGAYRARDELFGREPSARAHRSPTKDRAARRAPAVAAPVRESTQRGANRRPAGVRAHEAASKGGTRPTGTPSAAGAPTVADIPADATVVVIPGRNRYHLPNCRQLAGRVREDRTYKEVRDEGLAACRSCMPDNVLAARRSAHTGEAPDARGPAEDAPASDTSPDEFATVGVPTHPDNDDGDDEGRR